MRRPDATAADSAGLSRTRRSSRNHITTGASVSGKGAPVPLAVSPARSASWCRRIEVDEMSRGIAILFADVFFQELLLAQDLVRILSMTAGIWTQVILCNRHRCLEGTTGLLSAHRLRRVAAPMAAVDKMEAYPPIGDPSARIAWCDWRSIMEDRVVARREVIAEIAGRVWKIEARLGDRVAADEPIVILESMKMEIPVPSPADGTLVEIRVAEQEAVEEGQVVAVVEA